MASQLTLQNCVRGRVRAIQPLLVPISFIKTKFDRRPECFGPVYGLQAIIQESYTNSVLHIQKNIGAKYFAKAKACGPSQFIWLSEWPPN